MTDPPTNPLHRRLYLMGFDVDERQEIIDYCVQCTLAGIPIEPADMGLVISAMQSMAIKNLEIRLDK